MGASAPDPALCSMTWGSASADRSIIASKPLLRTPVPRPTGQDTRPPGQGRRRASAHREPRSTGYGRPRSSEPGAHGLTGARQTELFGAPRARPHRDREPGALRSTRPPTSDRDREPGALRRTRPPTPPGTGNRTSSEARPPTSDPGQGTGPLRRHGPPPRNGHVHGLVGKEPDPRGTADGALRSPARTASTESGGRHPSGRREPVSTGQGRRRPSGHRARRSTGTGNPALFGASGPPPHRDREPDLFGGSAPHPTGTGNRTSSEARPPTPPGPDLATGWAPRPSGQADGALRSAARLASRERTPRSSEHGAQSHRDRDPDLLGGPGAPRLGRAGTSRLAPATGAPRSAAHQDPGLETRTSSEAPGPPISRDTGHPAPRGRATGDPRAGITECTPPASAGWRSAMDTGFGRHPAPGRTVTAGRQRPQ